MISYTISSRQNGTLQLVIDGGMFTVPSTHPNYNEVMHELKKRNPDSAKVLALLDVQKAVTALSDKVSMQGDTIFYKSKKISNSLTADILDFISKDYPTTALVNFFEKLMENPSYRSTNELYDFLMVNGLTITPDGDVIGYKGVRADFYDVHSGTYNNAPGEKPRMDRNDVDDNREMSCSKGLHVGTFEYANSWAPSDGHVVMVKFNPVDAVSVPRDCSCQKLRTCGYEVLQEVDRPLKERYVDNDGNSVGSGSSGNREYSDGYEAGHDAYVASMRGDRYYDAEEAFCNIYDCDCGGVENCCDDDCECQDLDWEEFERGFDRGWSDAENESDELENEDTDANVYNYALSYHEMGLRDGKTAFNEGNYKADVMDYIPEDVEDQEAYISGFEDAWNQEAANDPGTYGKLMGQYDKMNGHYENSTPEVHIDYKTYTEAYYKENPL